MDYAKRLSDIDDSLRKNDIEKQTMNNKKKELEDDNEKIKKEINEQFSISVDEADKKLESMKTEIENKLTELEKILNE